jgi:hypothetical protein
MQRGAAAAAAAAAALVDLLQIDLNTSSLTSWAKYKRKGVVFISTEKIVQISTYAVGIFKFFFSLSLKTGPFGRVREFSEP